MTSRLGAAVDQVRAKYGFKALGPAAGALAAGRTREGPPDTPATLPLSRPSGASGPSRPRQDVRQQPSQPAFRTLALC